MLYIKPSVHSPQIILEGEVFRCDFVFPVIISWQPQKRGSILLHIHFLSFCAIWALRLRQDECSPARVSHLSTGIWVFLSSCLNWSFNRLLGPPTSLEPWASSQHRVYLGRDESSLRHRWSKKRSWLLAMITSTLRRPVRVRTTLLVMSSSRPIPRTDCSFCKILFSHLTCTSYHNIATNITINQLTIKIKVWEMIANKKINQT